MTADKFEANYAHRSGITVEALRAHGRIVAPCHCGDDNCEGWQSVNGESYREDLALYGLEHAEAHADEVKP